MFLSGTESRNEQGPCSMAEQNLDPHSLATEQLRTKGFISTKQALDWATKEARQKHDTRAPALFHKQRAKSLVHHITPALQLPPLLLAGNFNLYSFQSLSNTLVEVFWSAVAQNAGDKATFQGLWQLLRWLCYPLNVPLLTPPFLRYTLCLPTEPRSSLEVLHCQHLPGIDPISYSTPSHSSEAPRCQHPPQLPIWSYTRSSQPPPSLPASDGNTCHRLHQPFLSTPSCCWKPRLPPQISSADCTCPSWLKSHFHTTTQWTKLWWNLYKN